MNRLPFLSGLVAGMLVALAIACGGGGSSDPLVLAMAPQARLVLAFEEQWEPRTLESGVFGTVSTHHPLGQTADGSDPQETWAANSITGKWGTLAGLDGTVPGLPNVTGNGPNQGWSIDAGRLAFHGAAVIGAAGSADGFALISRQTFPRNRRIVVEADMNLTNGSDQAFAGLALIAGEGDYREIAFRRTAGVDYINRCTPLRETPLVARPPSSVTFRIEYDPVTGFRYLVNGQLVGTEALDHEGASFAADPHVGLYFAGNPTIHGSFAEGLVGPVRVWVAEPLSITTKEASRG